MGESKEFAASDPPHTVFVHGLVQHCGLQTRSDYWGVDTARDSLRGLLIWKDPQKMNGRRARQVLVKKKRKGKDQDSWQVNVSVEPDHTHYENYDDEPPFIPEDVQRAFNRH